MPHAFMTPTPKREWVRAGDGCLSMGGEHGVVIRVVEHHSLAIAVVRWEKGNTGRCSITTLRKADSVSSEALSYGVRCSTCGEYETACTCEAA